MLEPKTVQSSAVEGHVYKIFPNDLNTNGTVFGGLVMSLLDRAALVVAERHSEQTCVTVSVDALHFLAPAHMGENLLFFASVNRTWNSSMEIGVRVVSESFRTKEKHHVVSAYFTFVAVDSSSKAVRVPSILPETPLQKRRFEEAGMRRLNRIKAAEERKRIQSDLGRQPRE